MNRSSIRKSFLDDLLGDSDSTNTLAAPTDARQQQQQLRPKSVRFLEKDDGVDILSPRQPTLLSPSASVPSKTVTSQDGSASDSGSKSTSSPSRDVQRRQEPERASATTATSSSDWLGLSEERNDGTRNRASGKQDQRIDEDDFGFSSSISRKRESYFMIRGAFFET